jgi:hypothetical protein
MNPRRILMVMAAGLVLTVCLKALSAQVSSDVTLSSINGDDHYPSSCGASSHPAWCAGNDMGAWINSYVAAFGPVGRIVIPQGTYTFSTPINISQTTNQSLTIECTSRAAVLKYTGSGQAISLTGIGDPSSEVQVNNCTLSGDNAESGTNGIVAHLFQNLHLTNVRVQNFQGVNVLLHGVIGGLFIGTDLVGAGTYNYEIQPDTDGGGFGSNRNLMYGGSLQYAGTANFWDSGVSGIYGGDTGDILNGVTFECLTNGAQFIIEGTWNDAIENSYLEYFQHSVAANLYQGWVGNYAGSGVGSNTTQTARNFVFMNNTLVTPKAGAGSVTASLYVVNSDGLLAENITDVGAPTYGLYFYQSGNNSEPRTSGLIIGWQVGQYANPPAAAQLEQTQGQPVAVGEFGYGASATTDPSTNLQVQALAVNGSTFRTPFSVYGGTLNADGMNPSVSAQMVDVDTVLGNSLATRHGVLQVYAQGAANLGTVHYNLDIQPYGGTTQIGNNGTPFNTVLTGTAVVTWPGLLPGATQLENVPMSNASLTNFGVSCSPQGDIGNASVIWSAQVVNPGVITIRMVNPGASTAAVNSVAWGCNIIQ